MITSLASSLRLPLMQIPSPGAVCPAMVRLGFHILIAVCNSIIPLTLNTTVLGPLKFSQAYLKLPDPESFKLVTSYIIPPLPPVAYAPAPSAPGKAGICDQGY